MSKKLSLSQLIGKPPTTQQLHARLEYLKRTPTLGRDQRMFEIQEIKAQLAARGHYE